MDPAGEAQPEDVAGDASSGCLVKGCVVAVIAAAIALVGFLALLFYVASQMPDFSDVDISVLFSDECSLETEMPAEPGIASDGSTLLGWNWECGMLIAGFPITQTWYYGTNEPRQLLMERLMINLEQYARDEIPSTHYVSFSEEDTSVELTDTDPTENGYILLRAQIDPSRPAMHRTVPGGSGSFQTYYHVSMSQVLRGAVVWPTARPYATVQIPTPLPSIAMPTATPTVVPAFVQISAGHTHACGLLNDGAVRCWGPNDYGETDVPEGTFSAVSAGPGFTCGLRKGGEVDCWGFDVLGETKPPSGTFSKVSDSCGLRTDGRLECWGSYLEQPEIQIPTGQFVDLSVFRHGCTLASDGTVACWLGPYFYLGDLSGVGFAQAGQANPPEGTFETISVGGFHTCGLRPDHTAVCWGRGAARPGTFEAIAAGNWGICGIRPGGTVECWGDPKLEPVPAGQFVEISLGLSYACGLRVDGSVECWVGSSRVDLQACKLEYSIVSPK